MFSVSNDSMRNYSLNFIVFDTTAVHSWITNPIFNFTYNSILLLLIS